MIQDPTAISQGFVPPVVDEAEGQEHQPEGEEAEDANSDPETEEGEQNGCNGVVDDPETLDVVGAFFVPSGKTLRRRASIFFSKRAAWACRSFAESLKEARSRSVWLSRISIARETMEPV